MLMIFQIKMKFFEMTKSGRAPQGIVQVPGDNVKVFEK